MAEHVTLTSTWGQTPLPLNAAPQVNYLLVQADSTTPPTTSLPLNFCLVLDHSGSMKGEKLTNMKIATKRVIEMLQPHDIVTLVIFDDTTEVVVPATHAADRATLLARVETIEPVGGTAMSLGMQAGLAELRKHLSPDYLAHMLLLTDGQTWGDEETCHEAAKSLDAEGIGLTALGLGSEWNEQLLDTLADLAGGNSDYIANPASIDDYFARAVQTTQGTYAQDARLLLRFVRDVTPRAVHRVTPTIANLGYQPLGENEAAIKLGDLVYGTASSAMLELLIPSRGTGSFRIAQAELHYLPVGQTTEHIVKQDILLDFTADAHAATYTPQVMNLVEKVTAFKLQTRALAEADAGNISGATQKLRAAATRLLDLGELELAGKTQLQAEQLEQGAGISAETQKELRYATRRLTQKLQE
jgi:Ca-activated chloride channel family protein